MCLHASVFVCGCVCASVFALVCECVCVSVCVSRWEEFTTPTYPNPVPFLPGEVKKFFPGDPPISFGLDRALKASTGPLRVP